MTHGSKSHREHGSLGAGTTPGRVFPGIKNAGRMGNERVVVKRQPVCKLCHAHLIIATAHPPAAKDVH